MRTLTTIMTLLLLLGVTASAQTITTPKSDLSFTRSDVDEIHTVHVAVRGLQTGQYVRMRLIDKNTGTAQAAVDYEIVGPYGRTVANVTSYNITIHPDADQTEAKTIILKFDATYRGENLSSLIDTIIIKPHVTTPPGRVRRELAEVDSPRFTILTAGSLNFFGNSLFSKYVGQLDIRLPALLGNDRRWGLNTGVFTKNFFSDSAYTGHATFNVKIPKDTLNYAVKQYDRYAKKVYSTVGAYFNPTFLLASGTDTKNSAFRIYLDASFEVLATTIKTTYNNFKLTDSVGMKYDPKTTPSDALDPDNPRIKPLNSFTSKGYITGYFGFGPQIVYQQNNLLNLNLLGIIGQSITGDPNEADVPNNYVHPPSTRKFYYLVKGVITEKVTKLNATIGVEVRGFYPNNTGIAAYLGFLISPADFFKK